MELGKPLIVEKRRFKRKRDRLIISTIVIALLCFLGGSYAWNTITKSFVQVEAAKVDYLEKVIPLEGLVIRDEVIINTPANGNIKKIVPEGEKVRVGKRVAEVTKSDLESNSGLANKGLFSPMAGLVSYKVDGLEEVLNSKVISQLDIKKVLQLAEANNDNEVSSLNGDSSQSPESSVKIINNLGYIYVLAKIEDDQAGKLIQEKSKKGKTVKFQWEPNAQDDKYFYLRINKVTKVDNDYIVLFETAYYHNFFNDRKINLNLVIDRYEGIKIQSNALVYKNDKPGIYKVKRSMVTWIPVKVLGKIGDMAVVENKEQLSINDHYVVNPSLVSEGTSLD